MNSTDIRPFIQVSDLKISTAFYEALGFSGDYAHKELVLLSNDHCAFFLYSHDKPCTESNCMFQLVVSDIEKSLAVIENLHDFNFKYEPIRQERWGRVIYLWGLDGEMWHITELL